MSAKIPPATVPVIPRTLDVLICDTVLALPLPDEEAATA